METSNYNILRVIVQDKTLFLLYYNSFGIIKIHTQLFSIYITRSISMIISYQIINYKLYI